jgi:predicted aspartyl protease
MRRIAFILLLLYRVSFCCGQQQARQPDAQFITKFSFRQFNGGIMLVRALLNNIPDTLNFILDTGSGGISLDSSTCEEFKIKTYASDTTINGMGDEHKVRFAFNQTLRLPGIDVDGLDFHVDDYNVLSSVYGEKIDGIIGYSFFSRYIVKVDFDSMEVEVYTPGKIKYPDGGELLHPVFTTLPVERLQIKDARKIDYNFYFDTGAGLCFLMSEDFAEDSSILLRRRKPVITEAEGLGGKLQMKLTVVKKVQIGRFRFKDVPAYIFKDAYNVTSYPYVGGLIGDDLLRRFNLTINYPGREIYLLPNSHFKDSFDYAYTGLAIYYISGNISVEEVVPGSPADEAGLLKGDILMGVAANFTNNIQQYKSLLQSANKKINLVIKRADKLHLLAIIPTSILQ